MSLRKRKKHLDQEEEQNSDCIADNTVDNEEQHEQTPPEEKGLETRSETKKRRKCFSLKCFLVKFILPASLLLVFLRYGIVICLDEYLIWRGYGQTRNLAFPINHLHLFSVFDDDKNGVLDPEEFMFAAEAFTNSKNNLLNATARFVGDPYEPLVFIDEHRRADLEFIEVKVDFEPLLLSTMRRFSSVITIIGDPHTLIPGLMAWKKPHIPVAQYGVKNFKQFTPPPERRLGEPYFIVPQKKDNEFITELMMSDTTPYKHAPPNPKSNEVFLHVLMLQLHKYPFVHLRFGPRGTVGIVRAENNKYWDILIRAHVEFQLNDYPDLPFWFTPAQFAGRLIISKDISHIVMFEMEVPNNRSLNIDMEWVTSPNGESNEVDIGFSPMMKLSSLGPSRKEGTTAPLPPEPEPKWTSQIDAQEARDRMERVLYPFKEVKYHNFKEAFDLASEQQKPVHHILLWGALDDQSC